MGGEASAAEEVAEIVIDEVVTDVGKGEAKAIGFGVGGEVSAPPAAALNAVWKRPQPLVEVENVHDVLVVVAVLTAFVLAPPYRLLPP
jgi:hypothetical protein